MVISLFFPVKPSKERVEIRKTKCIFLFSMIVSAPQCRISTVLWWQSWKETNITWLWKYKRFWSFLQYHVTKILLDKDNTTLRKIYEMNCQLGGNLTQSLLPLLLLDLYFNLSFYWLLLRPPSLSLLPALSLNCLFCHICCVFQVDNQPSCVCISAVMRRMCKNFAWFGLGKVGKGSRRLNDKARQLSDLDPIKMKSAK